MLSLREAIAGYVSETFDLRYDPKSEILITVGVSEAIDLAFRALLDPGDEVIYHEPCYVSYNPSIALAYGVPVAVATKPENDFSLKAADVAAAVTPKTATIRRRGAHVDCDSPWHEGADDLSPRILKGLRDDGFSYRLCVCPSGADGGNDEDPPVFHALRTNNESSGGD